MRYEPFSISFVPPAILRMGCPGGWTPDAVLDAIMRFSMLWLDCAVVEDGKRRATTSLYALSVGKDESLTDDSWRGPFRAQGKIVDWLDGAFCKYLPAFILNETTTLSSLQAESDRAGGVLRLFSPFECSMIGSKSSVELQRFLEHHPTCLWARWQRPEHVSKGCERVYRGYVDALEQCSLIIDNRAIHERLGATPLNEEAIERLIQFALDLFMQLEPPIYRLSEGAKKLLTDAARHWGHPKEQPRFAKGFRTWCGHLAESSLALSLVISMLDMEKSEFEISDEHMAIALRWHLLSENQAWSLFEEASIRDAIYREEKKNGRLS